MAFSAEPPRAVLDWLADFLRATLLPAIKRNQQIIDTFVHWKFLFLATNFPPFWTLLICISKWNFDHWNQHTRLYKMSNFHSIPTISWFDIELFRFWGPRRWRPFCAFLRLAVEEKATTFTAFGWEIGLLFPQKLLAFAADLNLYSSYPIQPTTERCQPHNIGHISPPDSWFNFQPISFN